MKALYFEKYGDENVLQYGELQEPSYFPNSALIKVEYCALNYLDIWVRQGLPGYKIPIPHILGSDISGTVIESEDKGLINKKVILYPGINWCKNCEFCFKGDINLCKNYNEIGFQVQGGYAEYIRVPLENVFLLPEYLSLEEGACIPLTLTTVSRMLFVQANVKPHQTVLIMAAGSGIGVMAFTLLKSMGIETICAVGSDWKVEKLANFGIKHIINYSKDDLEKKVREITNGAGVDVVIEHTGGNLFTQAIKSLKRGGVLVTCGATGGDPSDFNLRHFFIKQLQIKGSMMGSLNDFSTGLKIFSTHKLKSVIDSVFTLKDGKEAHRKMRDRNIFGKVILKIA